MQAIMRKAMSGDAKTVAGLAIKMWKSHTVEELTEEFSDYISKGNCVVVLAMLDNCAIGFAQCGLRHDYVEGTDIWRVFLLRKIIEKTDWQKICWMSARNGRRNKGVQNLPVTVNW